MNAISRCWRASSIPADARAASFPFPMSPRNAELGSLDYLSVAVLLLDDDNMIIHANLAAESLWRLGRGALAGMALSALFPEHTALFSVLREARRHNCPYREYGLHLTCITQARALVTCTATPADRFMASMVLEFQPSDQQTRLMHEDHMLTQQQTNMTLLRNLAHEIKNPLSGLRGSAQLLEKKLSDPALHEYTQVMIAEADRLQALLDQLLLPYRQVTYAAVNIHEVLARVCALVRASTTTDLEIQGDYDVSLPELWADQQQLIQTVFNIMHNAITAMQGRGKIALSTRAERQVTLLKKRHPLAIQLQIIDDGPGIPAEIRDRIFYPLVSGQAQGTGLGLTLALSFITQHQGTITVDSRPGHTCFTIRLPVSCQAAPGHSGTH